MNTAVVLIATGKEEYKKNIPALLESLDLYFPPHQAILFTDSPDSFNALKIWHQHPGWPQVTLLRYHAMLGRKELLARYEQIFYLDTDMLACNYIKGEDIFTDGIAAVLHPGFVDHDPTMTFETNPSSRAYIPHSEWPKNYFQGCFVGGSSGAFLDMCETIAKDVDDDLKKGIIAFWWDEAHLNRYLKDHPPARILSPAYCYPGNGALKQPERFPDLLPKIRHLEKNDDVNWKFNWRANWENQQRLEGKYE